MGIGEIASTGMQTAMSNMDVIGNNIANASTPGLKKSTANFADLFPAGNATGLGVRLEGVKHDCTPGGQRMTGEKTHLMINNEGFFILKNANSGQVSYTRAGQLSVDNNGYFISSGRRLQGFAAINGQIPAGNTPTDLRINFAPMNAQATTSVKQ